MRCFFLPQFQPLKLKWMGICCDCWWLWKKTFFLESVGTDTYSIIVVCPHILWISDLMNRNFFRPLFFASVSMMFKISTFLKPWICIPAHSTEGFLPNPQQEKKGAGILFVSESSTKPERIVYSPRDFQHHKKTLLDLSSCLFWLLTINSSSEE